MPAPVPRQQARGLYAGPRGCFHRPPTFDGCVKRSSDGDHDGRAKDPEDVVEEEAGQQERADVEAWQHEERDAVQREGKAVQVGRDPVLQRTRMRQGKGHVVRKPRAALAGPGSLTLTITQSGRRFRSSWQKSRGNKEVVVVVVARAVNAPWCRGTTRPPRTTWPSR